MQVILLLFANLYLGIHDLHLSMCVLNYNDNEERIEVQQRIFYDDLEKSLQIQLNDKLFDILKPEESSLNYDSLLIDYANNHIELEVNGDEVVLELLEYEINDDAIVLYMYKSGIPELKSINIFSHVLFEIFNDQDNVISVEANGKKKSAKFDVSSESLSIVYSD